MASCLIIKMKKIKETAMTLTNGTIKYTQNGFFKYKKEL